MILSQGCWALLLADYAVVVCPSLPVWSEGGQDHVIVKRLDLNSIRVISSVLGQSVALDFYAKTVSYKTIGVRFCIHPLL